MLQNTGHHISGELTSPLTLTTPYSARYYPCFMDEKYEAQGQHLSRVFESVNDESLFGLQHDYLTGGWTVCNKTA